MAKRKRKKKNRLPLLIFALIGIVFAAILIVSNPNLITRFYKPVQHESHSFYYYRTIFSNYSVFGIDVSQYQAKINWRELSSKQKIDFVFIRATAGNNRIDSQFFYNWEEAKKYNIARGAYHYYRPNENSKEQAENFINTVNLEKGDLPPVLDIEEYSRIQSNRSLKTGVLNWLNLVEEHYRITPILYTYNRFYVNLFINDSRFVKYPLWIAWYNTARNPDEITEDWDFWQFTDKGYAKGIDGDLDINVYNGSINQLKAKIKKK
jgi:lysozyme